MASKPSRPTKRDNRARRRYFPLGSIIDELLHNILDFFHETEDLLSLCLVSRRLYLFTVEHLYRDITFDSSAASHRQLLMRLTHENSAIVQRIRVLRLHTEQKPFDEYFRQLRLLITRMKNPTKFVIGVALSGPLGAADAFLYIIARCFPYSTVEIKQTGQNTRGIRDTLRTLTAHPACPQITRLDINLEYGGSMYPKCKRDLVVIIRSAQGLEHLRIRLVAATYFPEFLPVFQHEDFPRLKLLDLGHTETAIFTPGELMRWGKRGGWTRLTTLTTGSLDCFRCFVGRDVGLRELKLYTHDDHDFEEIDQIFVSPMTPTPFSDLSTFSCIEKDVSRRAGLRFMPVNILRWMPKLRHLLLARDENRWDPVVDPCLPSIQHVKDIRNFCPNLEFLAIEMGLQKAKNRVDLIKVLCHFEKLKVLHLFACLDTVQQNHTRELTYWGIAREMYHERRRLGLVWKSPFSVVRFTTVRHGRRVPVDRVDNFEVSFDHVKIRSGALTLPDWDVDEIILAESRKFDRMTVAELKARLYRTMFGKRVEKRSRFVKELERRKRDERMELEDDTYPTLYDTMVQQGS